jgi:hypothetical protein
MYKNCHHPENLKSHNLPHMFHIQNDLKNGDTFLPLLFSITLEHLITKGWEKQLKLELSGIHKFWICVIILIYRAEVQ